MRHTVVKPRYTNMKNQSEISWQFPAHPPPQRQQNCNEQAKRISLQSLGNQSIIIPFTKCIKMPPVIYLANCSGVTWSSWRIQIPKTLTFVQQLGHVNDFKISSLLVLLLVLFGGELIGVSTQMAENVERRVSIPWHHHDTWLVTTHRREKYIGKDNSNWPPTEFSMCINL